MDKPWTVKDILTWTSQYFQSKQIPDARLSAELLLARVLNCARIELYLQFERILSSEERSVYRKLVHRRAAREPVQYILGETEFMGLPIRVTPSVLIPRPETEILVDSVIEYAREAARPLRILDIGTGSGCIAIALAKLIPEAYVTATDITNEALEIAQENARLNEVEVTFHHGDIFQIYRDLPRPVDIIVSNPPYISRHDWEQLPPEIKEYEPATALRGGEDGMDFYRRLLRIIPELLAEQGALFLETGYDQARRVAEMFEAIDFYTIIRPDLNQIDRVVIARREEV